MRKYSTAESARKKLLTDKDGQVRQKYLRILKGRISYYAANIAVGVDRVNLNRDLTEVNHRCQFKKPITMNEIL